MNFKLLTLVSALTIYSHTHAASKNACDDLESAGSTSSEAVKECRASLGESDFYKSQVKKSESEKDLQAKAAAKASALAANIETHIFTTAELTKAAAGQPLFARTDDYRSGKEEHDSLTSGETLCKFLGFEKAGEINLSAQIYQPDSNNKGFIVKTPLLGGSKLSLSLYSQQDPKVGVRKYDSISCSKRKDKKMDFTGEALKSISEIIKQAEGSTNKIPSNDIDTQILDTKRDSKPVSTPHGYKIPDWMEDNGNGNSK